jgi:subtilisin-like proprotein convertase family protein
VCDLNVKVNTSHTYAGDVRMTLIAPDGTRVVLVNRRGGSGNDFANTVFDDEGTGSIYSGQAPFAGSFKPEYVLRVFDGKSAKGTWQLVIDDTSPFDVGRLNAWSLAIEGTTTATAVKLIATTAPTKTPAPANLPSAPPVDRNGQVSIGLASYFVRLRG